MHNRPEAEGENPPKKLKLNPPEEAVIQQTDNIFASQQTQVALQNSSTEIQNSLSARAVLEVISKFIEQFFPTSNDIKMKIQNLLSSSKPLDENIEHEHSTPLRKIVEGKVTSHIKTSLMCLKRNAEDKDISTFLSSHLLMFTKKSVEKIPNCENFEQVNSEMKKDINHLLLNSEEAEKSNLSEESKYIIRYNFKQIANWVNLEGISEMEYQQSGIYPLLSWAFHGLEGSIFKCSNVTVPFLYNNFIIAQDDYHELQSMKPDGVFYYKDLKKEKTPYLLIENARYEEDIPKDWKKLLKQLRYMINTTSERYERSTFMYGILTQGEKITFLKMESELHSDNTEYVFSYIVTQSVEYHMRMDYSEVCTVLYYIRNQFEKLISSQTDGNSTVNDLID